MDNKEDILDALDEFSRKPASKIPPLLDQYLRKIAKSGETIFPWSKLKPLFTAKLENCMEDFYEKAPTDELPPCPNVENVSYREMKSRLLKAINNFNNAPFTIQRLCELITEPHKHYKRTDKFLRGIEKNIMVVSCVDCYGTKIVNEGKNIMNGLDTNGEMKTPERKSSQLLGLFAPPPAPTNSPVMLNPFESRVTESTSPTALSVWPLASRFISNNGDGPWPQAAMAAASSSIQETSVVLEMPKAGELSSSSLQASQHTTVSSEEKSMEVEEEPRSSEQQIPSTTTREEKPTPTDTAPDVRSSGDAIPASAEISSTDVRSSKSDEADVPKVTETKAESPETVIKAESANTADDEVSSSDTKHDKKETVHPHEVAEPVSVSQSSEKPASPLKETASPLKETSPESCETVEEKSDSVAPTTCSNSVSESTSQESAEQTVETSDKVSEPSPVSSDSVTSSESSTSEKSDDISPSSSSNREESRDTPSSSEEQSSSLHSVSDSTTSSETPPEEAMDQD